MSFNIKNTGNDSKHRQRCRNATKYYKKYDFFSKMNSLRMFLCRFHTFCTPRRASIIDTLLESGRRSSLGQALEEASSKIKEASSKIADAVNESIFSGETIKQWVDFIKLQPKIYEKPVKFDLRHTFFLKSFVSCFFYYRISLQLY